MIDKVVRLRTQLGRFGLDHSELLNYEKELYNKSKVDYMNWLVYKKGVFKAMAPPESFESAMSQVLFTRLAAHHHQKEPIKIKEQEKRTKKELKEERSRSPEKKDGLSYDEWILKKDMAKRLKSKLIKQAKAEIKQQLLDIAKQEQDKELGKSQAMHEWLM